MSDTYHAGHRELQDRFDSRRLADRLDEVKVHRAFTEDDKAFIERLDMLLLATADADGQPTCSYKGGEPGFVRVVDERTLVFPSYDGNGMFLSLGNVRQNAKVGLLFLDFEAQRRLRVNGTADVHFDDPAMAWFPEAQMIVRVTATQIFPNCPRYIHKRALVERSAFVPKSGCVTPTPAWKESPWAKDVLPRPGAE